MLIIKRSIISGKMNTRDIPVEPAKLDEWLKSGNLIQCSLPELSDDDREFLLSGITPEEWEEAFGGDK